MVVKTTPSRSWLLGVEIDKLTLLDSSNLRADAPATGNLGWEWPAAAVNNLPDGGRLAERSLDCSAEP